MPTNIPRALAIAGIAIFVIAAAIAPAFSHPAYSSVSHSLSELAGQAMPYAWIMRGGFVAFGLSMVAASLMRLSTNPLVFGALLVFGAGMFAAALWSHLPIPDVGGGAQREDDLHSIAATIMGIAFCSACAAQMWTGRQAGIDWLSATGLAAAIVLPIVMFGLPDIAGVAQRTMFVISFFWIMAVFRS